MKLQTLNFAAGSRVRNTKQKNEKLGQKGAWPGSRDLLFNFGTPLLSPVRMKIQMLYFAGRLKLSFCTTSELVIEGLSVHFTAIL